ncbi:MAG: FtsW/RodA/SpoVE family cell cycle protein, partial [Victivallaceae bacterium]
MRLFKRNREDDDSIFAQIKDIMSSFDYLQITVILLLLTISVTFIYNTGAQNGSDYAMSFWKKQLQWIGVGFAGYVILSAIDYRRWVNLSFPIYVFALIMLIAVLFFGRYVYGARRWLVVPGVDFRIQPSELAKFGTVLFLSSIMGCSGFNVNRLVNFLFVVVTIALPFALIVVEPDLGSSIILLPIGAVLIFLAGLKWRYIIGLLLSGVLLIAGFIINEAYKICPILHDYQWNRLKSFVSPDIDIHGINYNATQARLAVGSGGLTGKGIGEGTQNALGFLPQSISNNDFIFSVIAEEVGFLGCLGLYLLYILLFYSILRTAYLATDKFGRYVSVGFGIILFTHVFINTGMSIGVTPITGLSLPLISYGGSFVFSTL